MTFDQLRYLSAVARTAHIGAAAKALSISPSAISHALNALSDELGFPILLKVGRNIALTAKGEHLAARATQIVNQLVQIEDEYRSADLGLAGNIRISATSGLPSSMAVKALAKLREQHPNVFAECSSCPSIKVIEDVLHSKSDLGICYSPQPHIQLASESIGIQKLAVVVGVDHPILKVSKKDRLKNLTRLSSAMPMSSFGVENCQKHPALLSSGLEAPLSLLFDNYETCIEYLYESDAWSFLPEFYLKFSAGKICEAVSLKQTATTAITVIYLKNRGLTATMRAFVETLKINSSNKKNRAEV